MKMKKKAIQIVMLLVLIMLGILYSPNQKAFAAETAVEVCAVAYSDESILVFNNGNNKIHFATEVEAAKGNWDVIFVKDPSYDITVIDISWLSPNVENTIVIKGDVDESQSRVIINAKPKKLDVSINFSDIDRASNIGSLFNIMSSEGTGVDPIDMYDLQWRKGDDGQWMDPSLLTIDLLKNYLIRGTYLYFRIAPVNTTVFTTDSSSGYINMRACVDKFAYTNPYFVDPDTAVMYHTSDLIYSMAYPDGSEGRRASNDVKLRITKSVTPPVAGIDGEDFSAEIKYGKEYRVTVFGSSDPVYWRQVIDRSIKSLPLSTILYDEYDGLTDAKAFPKMMIEVRNYATVKAAPSKITVISLEAQRLLQGDIVSGPPVIGAPATDKDIYISYTGTKNVNIQIPSASKENPYEYCVVKPGYSFDINRAAWTEIAKNTSIKVLASKAIDQGKLYIRMKEVKYKAPTETSPAISYKLASTMKSFDINYPSMPVAIKETHIYTKDYPSTIDIVVTLNVLGKMPYETALKYVKLGTKDVPVVSSTVTPAFTGDPNQVYTMTIVLNSAALETMTNCTNRALGIYYMNGSVDKISNKLTIKSPTPSGSLTAIPKKGTAINTTAFDLISIKDSANTLAYFVDDTEVVNVRTLDLAAVIATGHAATLVPFTTQNVDNILVPAGNSYLTIFEIDASGCVVKYKSQLITDFINN